jgi:hypothetical protein
MFESSDWGQIFQAIKLAFDGYKIVRDFLPKNIPSLGKADFEGSSSPFARFKGEETFIFMSSLFAPPEVTTPCGKIHFLYSASGDALVPVSTGYNVTGVEDAIGLSKVTSALVEHGARVNFEFDRSANVLKENHLILIGGPAANAVGHTIYESHISPSRKFLTASGGVKIGRHEHRGGQFGWLCSVSNPWNPAKRVLWLAGMGPFGTGAAVEYAISYFAKCTPPEVQGWDDWTVFIRGVESENHRHGPPEYMGAI